MRKTKNNVIRNIELEERYQKKLERMAKAREKVCKNPQDIKLMEKGYEIGYAGEEYPKEYENSGVFRNGYDRGVRVKKIEEYEKNKKIVEKMVQENIPFEDAPDEIKNDTNLEAHYNHYQIINKYSNKTR